MQKKSTSLFINSIITLSVLIAFFFISLVIHTVFHTQILIPPLFVLAVFLISMHTDGYRYGIVAAFISVLAAKFLPQIEKTAVCVFISRWKQRG